MSREKKAPLKFPQAAQAVDLSALALHAKGLTKRVQALIVQAAEVCKGEDPVWDVWIVQHLGRPEGALNGIAGLPMATDAYMRGLHHGLKAHIPIADTEEFAAKRNEFAAYIARAAVRYGVVEAASKVILGDEKAIKEGVETCNRVDAAFKRLEDLKNGPKPREHPLVKAQRIMGEKIVDVRTTKNRPELPEQDRAEATRIFQLLQGLYQEMFGALFPG